MRATLHGFEILSIQSFVIRLGNFQSRGPVKGKSTLAAIFFSRDIKKSSPLLEIFYCVDQDCFPTASPSCHFETSGGQWRRDLAWWVTLSQLKEGTVFIFLQFGRKGGGGLGEDTVNVIVLSRGAWSRLEHDMCRSTRRPTCKPFAYFPFR